jgi:hypothetical protein
VAKPASRASLNVSAGASPRVEIYFMTRFLSGPVQNNFARFTRFHGFKGRCQSNANLSLANPYHLCKSPSFHSTRTHWNSSFEKSQARFPVNIGFRHEQVVTMTKRSENFRKKGAEVSAPFRSALPQAVDFF